MTTGILITNHKACFFNSSYFDLNSSEHPSSNVLNLIYAILFSNNRKIIFFLSYIFFSFGYILENPITQRKRSNTESEIEVWICDATVERIRSISKKRISKNYIPLISPFFHSLTYYYIQIYKTVN